MSRWLWRCAAWGGIGLSLYAGWLTADDIRDRASSERDINAACDGLVSAASVMDLQGGMVRAETSDYDRLDARELPSSCTVYKVPSDDVTAVADRRPEARQVGDGTLGWYGNWYTTIRAECGPGSSATAPKLLNVTARADYEDVSAADRQRLARLARSAAKELADRIGCQTQLPQLPDHPLEPVPSALHSAKAADGSCSWFARHLKEQGQGRLPDRALAAPTRDANPIESCFLAVSPDQVGRIGDNLPDDQRRYARSALTHSPWWLRTVSYFGPEAHTVGYDDYADGDKVIEAGTAGHTHGAWWASSTCDGKPALHTLSSSYVYDGVLGAKALSALFRAYVDDITKRRGCTDVIYPPAASVL
ncbi:hypothetical protein SSP24_15070 [Streptomyces spinoverrucosus]|uniref:Uncharacterized protein n=1 Tax=Streptomyces spinoverrucosus TaxID=284043 RepID=A0A4Y3V9I6_9ACTN|nr:hypothetical protein [Streptomyces spinoverrucosus]GEC03852.1 hypothetical protein SSP24_15070 [Streptomyces spinoverrucosus]GHB49817.1 hypothetical protein GCM10010397_19610 [Streptomyces spinoverrucosus]